MWSWAGWARVFIGLTLVACGMGDGPDGANLGELGGSGGAAGGPNSAAGAAGSGSSAAAGTTGELGPTDEIPLTGVGGGGGANPEGEPRTDLLLRDGWRFGSGDTSGAEAPDFDDLGWLEISVPHTWNALDGQDGGGDYYRGVGWYRRRLTAPAELMGRRVFLQFDAANAVADVYLNGTLLGQHRGGYSAFRFDATAALVPGENVLAVKVDNTNQVDIPPLVADFTFFGGIYRDVHVLVSDALHIDLLDYASSGVTLRTQNVSDASANIEARVRVRNDGGALRSAELRLIVSDATGAEVARVTEPMSAAPGETEEVSLDGLLQSPHLWDGRRDPYLYSARIELVEAGLLIDAVNEPLGIRSFSIDPNTGLLLNGRPYDLYGPNRHQDRQGRGWAIGEAEHDEDMALIVELGATGVRLAHYQHAQYFYDLCDREGMVVWAEIPLVDAITDSPAFTDNARQQLIELIRQSRNHPSIVLWGIGNEQRTDNPATNALLADLGALSATEDDTRLSTYAHCCGADTSPLTTHADVVGYNYYYGWYMGIYEQVGGWADDLHEFRPALRFSLSEYGAGASISQHQIPPVQPVTTAPFHPEEYQTELHEETWRQLATRPYIWGKFFWNMFDFASDGRSEGDGPGRNDKGLITYDRLVKKDAFYWYKANWSSAPVVHITSRRFNPRTTQLIDVKVYSNQPRVTLELNGEGLPAQTSDTRSFLWAGVSLVQGDNQVVAAATDADGNVIVTDTVTWTF